MADGTIDAICSDHTPVDDDAKQVPFARSGAGRHRAGIAVAADAEMGARGAPAVARALWRGYYRDPLRVLGLTGGALARRSRPPTCACSTPESGGGWSPRALHSQGKNTPLLGLELQGRVRYTLVDGEVVFESSP